MEFTVKLTLDYLSKLSLKEIDDKKLSVYASIDSSKYSMTNLDQTPNQTIYVDKCMLIYFDLKIGKITVSKSSDNYRIIISAPSKKDLHVISHDYNHDGDILVDSAINEELFENFKNEIKRVKKIKERKYFAAVNKYSNAFYDGEHDKRVHFFDLLFNKSTLVEKKQDRNIHEITINNVKFMFIIIIKEYNSERYRAFVRPNGTLMTLDYFFLMPDEISRYNKKFLNQ